MARIISTSSQESSLNCVEGHISQNTTWTIGGSPYLVTGDVIVDAGTTLSIQPGVEVRFSGFFSLTINGSFYAVGNSLSQISFTSNEVEPKAGDWSTIRFTGEDTQFFEMKYCVVMYSTNGITIESTEKAVIEKCEIVNNFHRGIEVKGRGNINIKGNIIESSWEGISVIGEVCSGVTITDSFISSIKDGAISVLSHPKNYARISDLTISNNTVFSNGDGIYLHADAWYEGWIHDVTITGNTVSCNGKAVYLNSYSEWLSWMYDVVISGNNIYASESGIHLRAYHYGQYHPYESLQSVATITHNIVSANYGGISVLGDISANIMDNSISYNVYGIRCEWFGNMAHNNDIYRNSLYGIYVTKDGAVNAEYNYWGDPSGPYHETLNPDGKGNTVNGDETNLDFEPFLSSSIGQINDHPVASVRADKAQLAVNQTVTFNASTSYDDRRVSKYLFDFGDGNNSSWTTSSVVKHNYSSPGMYNASLVVIDDLGVSSSNTAIITMTIMEELPSLIPSLTLDPTTAYSEQQIPVRVHVTDGMDAVENASTQLVSDKGGTFEPLSGHTNSSGDFLATFLVPNVLEQTDMKITVTASKNGYNDGLDYAHLTVFPSGKGLDSIWILIIAIAVVVVVSVAWIARTRRRKHKRDGK